MVLISDGGSVVYYVCSLNTHLSADENSEKSTDENDRKTIDDVSDEAFALQVKKMCVLQTHNAEYK